jgi:hypothetical protein
VFYYVLGLVAVFIAGGCLGLVIGALCKSATTVAEKEFALIRPKHSDCGQSRQSVKEAPKAF